MQRDTNAPPLNPLPPVVWALALPIIAMEVVVNLGARGLVSRLQRKKQKVRPMSERARRANAARSAVRATVEHVLAHQKGLMSVVMRMIDLFRDGHHRL